ncbi:hypothetical protein ACHQM5_023534 [Ranunculus cassubicifolius]
MELDGEMRRWDELIPDALGLIFTNLDLQEILTVIPRVCKSWGKAVAGPYCWQDIDIDEWSLYCEPEQLGRMVQMLVARSRNGGSLRKLSVSGIEDEVFAFIADNACALQDLRVPRSDISNSIVEKFAHKLATVTFLDVSICPNIGASALEAIGKHCKSLSTLQRVMHPLTVEDKVCQNDEALAIANTMPNLKHLEIAYMLVSAEAVLQIIFKCPQLKCLDLRGCWEVRLDREFLKEKFPGLTVLGPIVEDSYERWDHCSDDDSEASSYLPWEFLAGDLDDVEFDDTDTFDEAWDDEQRLEELELRFYEGFDGGMEYVWPNSP